MKTILKGLLLATAITFTAHSPSVFSENQSPPMAPELQYFGKLIDKTTAERENATKEVETAKNELDKLKLATPPNQTKITEQETKIKAAQNKIEEANLQLYTFTKARAALSNQEPIHALIGELKSSLDKIPANGNDSQKAERSDIESKIKALEKLDHSEDTGWWSSVLSWVLGLFCFGLIGALVYFVTYGNASKNDADDDSVARVRLARVVTLGALVFVLLVSMLTLGFAGINAMIAPKGQATGQAMATFFDVAKWVFATVLPVVAAWVGGVMAYYFGKENFRAGAELAKEFKGTSQQKLETLKAGESGLEISKAAVYPLPVGTKLEEVNLKKLETAFTKNGKTYERLPILDEKGCVQACLHMSTLTKYIGGLTDADKLDQAKMTLGKLASVLPWNPVQSIRIVSPTDNLAHVQTIFNAVKECSDVFVTADGTNSKPAERWITNEDILTITNSTK